MIARKVSSILVLSLLMATSFCRGAPKEQDRRWPPLTLANGVDAQPLIAQVGRVMETLDWMGSPLPARTKAALKQAAQEKDEEQAAKKIQEALDPQCLLSIQINPESRVRVVQGQAPPQLVQGDWRLFLVKVRNDAGVTSVLRVTSADGPAQGGVPHLAGPSHELRQEMFRVRGFVGADVFNVSPFKPQLSGLKVEYRIMAIIAQPPKM